MGTRELKKRNHSKLLFGGVNIEKYASPSYIRKLLEHRRELLEGLGPDVALDPIVTVGDDQINPGDVNVALEDHVGDDPINPDDVGVALEEPLGPVVTVGDVQPLPESTGENPALAALDQVGSLTNALEQNQLPVALEQGTNPPSAIDAAIATVANLTNQLANTASEKPNTQLDASTADVVPSLSADVVESDIHPNDAALANLTNQLANTASEKPNNQLFVPTSSADAVEGDIHPTDAALNYISQLVGSFEEPYSESKPDEEPFSESKPDEEPFSESKPDEEPTSVTIENPAIAALNLISGIVAELALQQPSAVPPVTGPVGTGPSTSGPPGAVPALQVTGLMPSAAVGPPGAAPSGPVPSPTDDALDNILKFTQSLVSPLSTQTPPIIETPPTEPNTSSSFLPKLSYNGTLNVFDSLLSDEDMTQYEVEEYTTALGSDTKQNERKTMYNSDGATSGQHKWMVSVPALVKPSSQP